MLHTLCIGAARHKPLMIHLRVGATLGAGYQPQAKECVTEKLELIHVTIT
jgi:hypothetical protein